MSAEHYVSKCLADGKAMIIKGLRFCEANYVELPWSTATANVLCRDHNSALSPLDQAAQRYKDIVERIENHEHPARGTGLWLGPENLRMSGTRFGQWIAKSWCNQLAASKRAIAEDFVRYAFGRETQRQVRVFYAPRIAEPLETEKGHFAFMELRAVDGSDKATVLIEFYGHTWILANHDLKGMGNIEIEGYRRIRKDNILENPSSVDVQVKLPEGERATSIILTFDWPDPQPLGLEAAS